MEVTNPYASKKSTENSNNGSTTSRPLSDVIENDSAANYEIEFAHQQTVLKRIVDDRSNRLNRNKNLAEGKINNDEDEIRMLRNYGSLISSHASMVGMLQSNIHRASRSSDNNKNRNGDGEESVNSLKALLDYHYSTHNQHYEKIVGPYSDDDDNDDSNKNCNTKKTSFLLGDSQLLCSAFENQLSFYKTIPSSDEGDGDIDSLIDIDADVDEFFSTFPEYDTKISKKQQNNEDDDIKDEPEVQVLGTSVTIDVDDDDNCNNKKASSLQQHKRDIENKYYEPSQSQTTSKKKKKKSKHSSSSTTTSSVNNTNQINSSSSTKNKNPYAKQKRNYQTAPTIPESMPNNNVNTSQQGSSTHSGWNAYTQNPPPHSNMQQNMNPYQSNINPNNNNVIQNSFTRQPQHPPSNQGISNPNNMAYSASSKNPAINSFQTAKDLYDGGALNNEPTPQNPHQNQNRPYQPNEQYRSYNDRYPDHQRQGNPNTNNMNSYNHGYNTNNFSQNTNGFSNLYSNNNYDQSFQPNQVNMNPYQQQHQQPEQPQQGLRSPNIASSLKRKFKPPKRQVVTNNQNKRTNTNNTSTSNAGPKANNTNNNSSNSNKNNNKSKDDDEELPEELQHLDKELVKKIEQDILDNGESITFDDIAGLENAKQTVQELVIWPMQRPDLFTGLRKGPNGLLLFGPPGTGKTLIGKAVAHESGATFFAISSSSLTSKWIGEGEKMVKTLFAVARYRSPSVVFMDEVDSLLTQRKADENEASRRIKTEFLVQLDGTASNAKKGDGTGTPKSEMVLVIGATNLPHELDDAARRRFVKRIYIPLPEKADREVLIRTLMKKNVHSMSDKDFKKLSGDMTAGFSGADLKALCTDAALGPLRQLGKRALRISADDVPPISYKHFRSSVKGMNKSVSKSDLDIYIKWDSEYGSKISKEDDNDLSSSSDSESDDDE